MNEALAFCNENKTYSISNLKDTYNYFNRMNKKIEIGNDLTIEPDNELTLRYQSIDVKKRSLEDYKRAVKGEQE